MPPLSPITLAVPPPLQYVRHFPPGMKYVSLLRQASTPEAQAELELKRAKLRGMVAQRLAQVISYRGAKRLVGVD